jgi:multiple sugar transport system ATP-binding protein
MNFVPGRLVNTGTAGATFQSSGFELALPGEVFVQAPPSNADVVLGVRPEHIEIVASAGAPVSGVVSLVEPMGSHQVVWLDIHGHRLAASVPANDEPSVGSPVGLRIDARRACCFDPPTELRI